MTMTRRRSTSPATDMTTARPHRRSDVQSLLGVAVAMMSSACRPESETAFEYADYDGDAFPDRVSAIPYPQRAVGLITNSLSDTVSVVDVSAGLVIAERPMTRRSNPEFDGNRIAQGGGPWKGAPITFTIGPAAE